MTGQDYFYAGGQKINLERAPHWIGIQVNNVDLAMLLEEPDYSSLRIKQTLHRRDGIFWLEHRGNKPIGTSLDQLREKINIERIFPAYYRLNHREDVIPYIIYDEFRVKFVDNISEEEIKKLNEKYSVNIVARGFDNEYTLKVDEASGLSTIEIANIYYENDLTRWSIPDHYTLTVDYSIQDPYFDNQWHLKNTGQGGGVNDVDININIIDAWDISLGEGINIAMAEKGAVNPDHEDIDNNLIIAGYHAINETRIINPSDYTSHATGTTGIIAAQHNTIGVRGVAPSVKIMPIVLGLPGQIDSLTRIMQISNAIDTAWSRIDGADIINLSWGYTDDIIRDNIRAAMQRAMSLGRGGKGTVIVAAAGNDANIVTFPANVDSVLTVGAVTNTNERANYSPNSSLIDLVAPSSDSKTGYNLGITTTTLLPNGEPGYTNNFGFTSASSPQVSAVAALILSEKPEYTEEQVRNVIMASASFDPDYGVWAGNGRLNAYRALSYLNPQLSGPGIVCSETPLTIEHIPDGSNIVWDCGPDLNLISGQGSNPATFSSMGNGMSWVEATIETSYDTFYLNKDVWSGKPLLDSISGPSPPYIYKGCTGRPYTFWANPARDPDSQSSYQWMVVPPYFDYYFQYQYYDWATIVFNDPYDYYQVMARATNTCGSTSWITTYDEIGFIEIIDCYYFSMYPSPASEYITIMLTVPENDKDFVRPSEFNVQIIDNVGISYYSTTKTEDSFTIPVSNLRNGNYYVIITYGQKVESLPLVISK